MKCCPFCGSNDVRVAQEKVNLLFYVHCATCHTEGPWGKTQALAISQWNTRAADEF